MGKKPKGQDEYHLNEDVKPNSALADVISIPQIDADKMIINRAAEKLLRDQLTIQSPVMGMANSNRIQQIMDPLTELMKNNWWKNPYTHRTRDPKQSTEDWLNIFKDVDVMEVFKAVEAAVEGDEYVYDMGRRMVPLGEKELRTILVFLKALADYNSPAVKRKRLTEEEVSYVMGRVQMHFNHNGEMSVRRLIELAPSGMTPYVANIVAATLLTLGMEPA